MARFFPTQLRQKTSLCREDPAPSVIHVAHNVSAPVSQLTLSGPLRVLDALLRAGSMDMDASLTDTGA